MAAIKLPSGRWWDPGEDPYAYQGAASMHREEIERSERCGCIGCETVFAPTAITRWWDDGHSACCPHCGMTGVVVGSASGLALDAEFLALAGGHMVRGPDELPQQTAAPAEARRPWWRFW